MSEYEKQANDFAAKHRVELIINSVEQKKHFDDDKEPRDVYALELKRQGKGSYKFEFGQSIKNSRHFKDAISGKTTTDKELAHKMWGIYVKPVKGVEPTMYDVLACLTKHDPETFEDFCSEFGCDTDSKKAEKIYNAVLKEYIGVLRLFSDVMEELQEIQ
jgi:hypothetical protein